MIKVNLLVMPFLLSELAVGGYYMEKRSHGRHELLRVYIEHRSEAAFNELWRGISTWSTRPRSIGLRRATGADCVARGFCCLARNPRSIKIRVHWPLLYRTARFTAGRRYEVNDDGADGNALLLNS